MALPGEERFGVQRPLWRSVAWALIFAAVAVGVILQAWALTLIVDLSGQTAACTTPGESCYKERQKNLRAAINGVNEGTVRVVVAVEVCKAQGVEKQRALEKCALRRLED